ncbi:MAG: hypothetical protein ACHQEB_03340 [Chitinophagales bacterium]
MRLYILDGGIGNVTTIIWLFVVILLIVILIESVVMLLLKFNNFGKCVIDSIIVNVASALVGYCTLGLVNDISSGGGILFQWFIIYVITVIVEGLLLWILNRQQPTKKIWTVAITMNLVSYIFLYLISLL